MSRVAFDAAGLERAADRARSGCTAPRRLRLRLAGIGLIVRIEGLGRPGGEPRGRLRAAVRAGLVRFRARLRAGRSAGRAAMRPGDEARPAGVASGSLASLAPRPRASSGRRADGCGDGSVCGPAGTAADGVSTFGAATAACRSTGGAGGASSAGAAGGRVAGPSGGGGAGGGSRGSGNAARSCPDGDAAGAGGDGDEGAAGRPVGSLAPWRIPGQMRFRAAGAPSGSGWNKRVRSRPAGRPDGASNRDICGKGTGAIQERGNGAWIEPVASASVPARSSSSFSSWPRSVRVRRARRGRGRARAGPAPSAAASERRLRIARPGPSRNWRPTTRRRADRSVPNLLRAPQQNAGGRRGDHGPLSPKP